MKLRDLLEDLNYEILNEGPVGLDTDVADIVLDSRKTEPGILFTCIKGAVVDGHKFAPDVAAKGAAVIVVEDEIELPAGTAPAVVKVPDSRYALACISAAWFGHPAEKLKTIGITGTKGKTTTTYMVKAILENTGHKVGLIGTIEADTGSRTIPAANTTPESYLVQKYFAEMVENGCDCVVMEASSQGFMLHRTAGFTFDYGIFTNIEPDHIGPNEHRDLTGTMSIWRRSWREQVVRSRPTESVLPAASREAARMLRNWSTLRQTSGQRTWNSYPVRDIWASNTT